MKKQFETRSSLLFYFLRGNKRFFIISMVFAFLVALFDLFLPKVIAFTVDSVLMDKVPDLPRLFKVLLDHAGGTDNLREHMYLIAVLVITVSILRAICRYYFQFFNAMGEEKLVLRIRNILYDHMIHVPLSFHDKNQSGDIIQRCTSDVDTIRTFLSEQLTNLIRVIILITLAIIFMLRIHPGLALVAIALVPVIIGYSCYFHIKISESFEKVDAMEGRLSAMVQENLTGIRVVRAFGREAYEKEHFEEYNEKFMNTWVRLMKLLSSFWASGDLAAGIQVLLIIAIGAVFCVNGKLTAGQFIEFISYNSMLSWPVRELGRVISDMSKAGISIDRISYIVNSSVEQDPEDAKKPPLNRDIVFENVSFSYPESAPVIKNVNLTIHPGQVIGILGKTGSGKSTLVSLLDRLYDLKEDEGRILIGGIDIRDIDRNYLRKNIGIVLQEPYLFSGTLAENIGITSENAKIKEIRSAAKKASLDETILKFTKGYDTFVGERGVTLSGGQKQRTAIAQMLIKNSPIMIFDDSLSAVDAETDIKIRRELRNMTENATTILIAHRISTIMHADMIFVFDKGCISESGTHEELLKLGGIYQKVYDLQNAI